MDAEVVSEALADVPGCAESHLHAIFNPRIKCNGISRLAPRYGFVPRAIHKRLPEYRSARS